MAARGSGPQPAAWPPRLLLNTDGNWINNYQERHEPADITRLAGPLRAAGVDMLCALIGIDDDLSWRGSPHGQLWCDNVTEWNVDGVPTDIHGHQIREGGGVHIHGRPAVNTQATNAHQELYNTIVASARGRILNEDGTKAVFDAGAVRGLDLLQRFATAGVTSPSFTNTLEDDARLDFQAGNGA